jgi:hypothetical protein
MDRAGEAARIDIATMWLRARASCRLFLVAVALRWLGYRWAIARVPATGRRRIDDGDLMRAERYAKAIDASEQHQPMPTRCLARSLALHWWLRSEDLPSDLRIGVAKQGAALLAHAWVELGGSPVNERPAEVASFTPLTSMERSLGTSHSAITRRAPHGNPWLRSIEMLAGSRGPRA